MNPHDILTGRAGKDKKPEELTPQDSLLESTRIRNIWLDHPVSKDLLRLMQERKVEHEELLTKHQGDKETVYSINLKLQEINHIIKLITEGK